MLRLKSKKGQQGSTLWMLLILALLLIIVVPFIIKTYINARTNTDDCRGSCVVGKCMGVTVAGDCYKNGKKEDGICCITENDLRNGSNTTGTSGGTGTTPPPDEPKDCETYKPNLEIRKGQNTVEPISGGSLIPIISGEQLEYSFYTQRPDGKKCSYTCTIKALLDSTGQPTNRITLSPPISGATCTVDAKAVTKISGTYIEMPQGGWPSGINQNTDYKLLVESKYGETTVASAILRVEIKPPATITT